MFGLNTADILVLLSYFAIITTIGIVSARLVRNREDFLMGGRRFGKFMMLMFSFGSGTHADSAVGVAAQSYTYGFAGIWYQWNALFSLPVYWLLAPIFRRARVQTTADFFDRRFGSQMMYVYSFFALLVTVTLTSVILFGSARLIEGLTDGHIPWRVAIVATGAAAFFYGIAGGLIAAVWNDFLQGLLTVVMSLLLIPFFWTRIGGLTGFQAHLPDPHAAFQMVLSSDMTLYWIVMMTINQVVSMVAQPHIMANTGAAKSEMDSRVGFVGGLVLKRLLSVPWALTGVMAIALLGAGKIEPDHAFGAVCRELLPTGFLGLMLACVIASVMDTCAVMMLSFAGIYTNSIHKRFIDKQCSEGGLVTAGRVASLVFAAAAFAIAFQFTDVPAAMRFAWQTVPLMGIPFFLGVLWRRANRWGALASFVAALAAMLVGQLGFHWQGDAGLPKVITLFLSTGVVAGVIVSLVTPPERKSRTENFFLLLNTPIGQEDRLRAAGFRESSGHGTFYPPDDTAGISPDFGIGEGYQAASKRARKESVHGFAVVTVVMLSIFAGGMLLAKWLGGN
jgi:SSS family transporter